MTDYFKFIKERIPLKFVNNPPESSDFINKIDTNSITNSPFFNITTIIEQVVNEIESVALQSIDDKSKKLKKATKCFSAFNRFIDKKDI